MGNRKQLYNIICELLSSEDIDMLKKQDSDTIATFVLGLGYFENVRNLFESCGYNISVMSDSKRWNILLQTIEKVVKNNG